MAGPLYHIGDGAAPAREDHRCCEELATERATPVDDRRIGQAARVTGEIDERLDGLGLRLPSVPKMPPGLAIPFEWVRVRGDRAFVSGHGPLAADGTPAGPFGKVPSDVSLAAAQESARLAGLAIFAGLKAALGDLDRIAGWLTVNGFVNADTGYEHTTLVLNPLSELVLEVFGPDVGAHARTAIGVATVPLNLPLVVSAEVELSPS
jgi:enamine deaminase RidA (YjgF/YER057c/UK114 family)